MLRNEATAEDISDDGFYFGGECKLTFGDLSHIYVSWDRITQRSDDTHYSMSLSSHTFFEPDSLTKLSANRTPVWSPHIGKRVEKVNLLGTDGIPFAIELETEAGPIFLGVSARSNFGDGDDVRVTTDPEAVSSMSTIWQSEATGDGTKTP